MRHRTKTLVKTSAFVLVHSTNIKTGKKNYTIKMNPWMLMSWNEVDIRNHFDPQGNRGIRGGHKWKFNSLEEAQHLLTMALIKWNA
jgi:hypothetical protein